jgi:hypothetical protein
MAMTVASQFACRGTATGKEHDGVGRWPYRATRLTPHFRGTVTLVPD